MTTAEMARERYYWLKSHGICVRCGQESAEPNKTQCWECAEKNKERRALRYAKMDYAAKTEYNEKIRMNGNARFVDRKARGLCVKCGKRAPAVGILSCNECRRKQQKSDAKRLAKRAAVHPIPIDMRNSLGLCRQCGEPLAKPEDKLCPACHDARVRVYKAINANPTPAMLRAREAFANRCRAFNASLYLETQWQKRENRAAVENYERIVARVKKSLQEGL